MTLQRRLEGVYRQYGPPRPDVAFATAEAFLDQLPNIMPFDAAHDLERCLRKAGRWISDIRDIKRNRRTSRRRTSRRVA